MRQLILHVGAPKCGSSALQSCLYYAQEKGILKKNNFCYPLGFSRGLGQGNGGPIYDAFVGKYTSGIDFSKVKSFLDIEENVFISDESLFGIIDSNKLNDFFASISDNFDKLLILVSVRDQSSWLVSDYSQHIKENKLNLDFVSHVVRREQDCNWLIFFNRLASLNKNIKVYACESKETLGVAEFLIGLEPGMLSVNNEKTNINISLSGQELEFRRMLNILGHECSSDTKVKIKEMVKDYDLKSQYKVLIDYIDKKNEGYLDTIKLLSHVSVLTVKENI